jgi:hypothetical protein
MAKRRADDEEAKDRLVERVLTGSPVKESCAAYG